MKCACLSVTGAGVTKQWIPARPGDEVYGLPQDREYAGKILPFSPILTTIL